MRRFILGAFLLSAACGGGARRDPGAVNQDPMVAQQRALRTAVGLSAAARALIAEDEKVFGQNAVESCLQEWIEGDGAADPGALVDKPDIGGFRRFLSDCLGPSPVPGDFRSADPSEARAENTSALRSASVAR
jgi:hypothetical protein